MKKQFLLTLFIVASTPLVAQEIKRPVNSIQVNFLGDGSLISLNYDKQFLIRSGFIVSGKLGLGYNSEFKFCWSGTCSPPERYLTVPHHITANVGGGRHFFELGLGGTMYNALSYGEPKQNYLVYPVVGYRLLPLKPNKLNFRIYGQVPFSGLETEIIFVPFGLSLGISY